MWKFLLPFAAFVALAVLFAFGLNPKRDIHYLPSPLIGKPAPIFTLSGVLDPAHQVSNAGLKGQVYVFNVWATWCAGCREEHETMLQIAQQKVVPILGLDWNDDRGRAAAAAAHEIWHEQDLPHAALRRLAGERRGIAARARGAGLGCQRPDRGSAIAGAF